ncbi:hypothetical protein [Vibrio phage vB_VhaS-a]|nr:hypothetical protein [Vibrio phage vB_VhaS-a]
MNISRINALLNIVEGIKQTNELFALPVEWSNGFLDARDQIREAKESEKDEQGNGKGYTLLSLDSARDNLNMLSRRVQKDESVKEHLKLLVGAQARALHCSITEVMAHIKESR